MLTEREHAKVIDALLLKRARGERLTKRESRLLAYRDAGRCKCSMRR